MIASSASFKMPSIRRWIRSLAMQEPLSESLLLEIAALYAGLIGVARWRAETGINSRPLTANVRPLMGGTDQT